MRYKLNNKGFTLIELLAVLVILTAIMGIAIPSISSSLERNKDKQNEARKKVLLSGAELYVSNHKNAITSDNCYIELGDLIEENLVTKDSIKDSDDKDFRGVIIYNNIDKSFIYSDESTAGMEECVN